ncbi:MAG: hypothetical protein GY832_15135 [Chloroflexi bacterium]|nr:hypothetical protein [Chloroflexota bacterium]
MNYSRFSSLMTIVFLALVAFTVRATSINAQSLWRDEVDALCYAHEFPHLIVQAFAPEKVGDLNTPYTCPSLPMPSAQSPDESASLRLARTFGGIIQQNGPLYFLLLRAWIAFTGTSEYAMRFFSLIFGVLAVPLVYVLGRRLFDHPTGFFAAFLATISPYWTWYSQEVKMYALVTALALLAIYALRRAVESGERRWWTAQIVVTSLAFYSHILAALLVPVQILLYLTWWPQARKRWGGALVSLACLTLPYLPLALWQAPQVFRVRETGFYPYVLNDMIKILLNGWSLGILSLGWPWGTALITILALWGLLGDSFISFLSREKSQSQKRPRLIIDLREDQTRPLHTLEGLREIKTRPVPMTNESRGGKNRFALVCWLVIPLLAVWTISQWQPLFTDRYFIWTSSAFYLLVALGLASIWRLRNWGRWVVLLLLSVVLVFGGVNLRQQAAEPTKSDFRAAAAYVAERYTLGELVIFQIPHGRYTFDYYFSQQEYAWNEGLFTNHRLPDGSYVMNEQNAAQRMQEMTAAYDTVWLIATETTMWDERELVRAWLEMNGERVDEGYFMWVDVYHYAK